MGELSGTTWRLFAGAYMRITALEVESVGIVVKWWEPTTIDLFDQFGLQALPALLSLSDAPRPNGPPSLSVAFAS